MGMLVHVTGVDEDGRSCVIEQITPQPQSFESAGVTVAFAAGTSSCPPPPRPPGRGSLVGVAAIPGTARWSFIEFPPGVTTACHHTDSVDFDVVLEGSVHLVLDDGRHRLDKGDAVVLNGVDHSWETDSEGCRMSVVVIASLPRDGEPNHELPSRGEATPTITT